MSLPAGARLGSHEIVSLLGAGGMGQVYRARDTNLGRDVALKLLPPSVAQDAERVARFRREAHVLATLNHPNIAGIYGLEEAGAHRFLVLELVDGPTLAERIRSGPLPVDEAMAIAREIAAALQAAHERGIIHRDLKPANIALSADDTVKVLDFGLAKALDPASGPPSADALNSPTITSPAMMTGLGVILGTAAYMSPEQAKGRPADKRSDVWAFGCVFFEMLTGTRPFKGEDVSDTVAAVIRGEPDWHALPARLPPSVRALIEGCLRKNPRERIADISTASFVLSQPVTPNPPGLRPMRRSPLFVTTLLVAGVALGAAAMWMWRPRAAAPAAPLTRFTVQIPPPRLLTLSRIGLTLSPDGRQLAYVAEGRLYLRPLSENDSQPIAGADPAIAPAFSPDGQSLVFWSDPGLKRISVNGGVPLAICDTNPAPFGLQWTDRGIFFGQVGRGIARVSPTGGSPELVVAIPGAESLVHGPQLLPDNDTLLFSVARAGSSSATFWDAQVFTHSLSTGRRKTVLEGGSDARYLPSGHLVYMVEGTMMAVPFDLQRLQVTGGAVPVVAGVRRGASAVGGAMQAAISNSGTLAYVVGPPRAGRDDIWLFDRKGGASPLKLAPGSYSVPRVSPNGKHLAFETHDGRNAMVSIYPLSGDRSPRRLTYGGNNRLPVWSRDNNRLAFQSDREGDRGIFWQPVDGGGAERLTRAAEGEVHTPEAWSRLDDVLVYSVAAGERWSLWMLSLATRKATPVSDVQSSRIPPDATFSHDGRWLAYQISDAGAAEGTTYVQPYPLTGTKYEIGRGGRPQWSPDGKELFFIPAPSQLSAVGVLTEPAFAVTPAYSLPRRFGLAPPAGPRPYDILPDGRFVAVDAAHQTGETPYQQIHVVLNWFDELKRTVSPQK